VFVEARTRNEVADFLCADADHPVVGDEHPVVVTDLRVQSH
jgi:hypothetical protein